MIFLKANVSVEWNCEPMNLCQHSQQTLFRNSIATLLFIKTNPSPIIIPNLAFSGVFYSSNGTDLQSRHLTIAIIDDKSDWRHSFYRNLRSVLCDLCNCCVRVVNCDEARYCLWQFIWIRKAMNNILSLIIEDHTCVLRCFTCVCIEYCISEMKLLVILQVPFFMYALFIFLILYFFDAWFYACREWKIVEQTYLLIFNLNSWSTVTA